MKNVQNARAPVKKRGSVVEKFGTISTPQYPLGQSKTSTWDNYDGIRELDNHLPPWWTGLFYFTIIWGAGYFIAYHVSLFLPLSGDEYANEQKGGG